MCIPEHECPLVIDAGQQIAVTGCDSFGQAVSGQMVLELPDIDLDVRVEADAVAGDDQRGNPCFVQYLPQRPQCASHALAGTRVDDVRPQLRGDVGAGMQARIHR